MATYDSLSNSDKNVLQNMTNMCRAWCGEQARSNNHADVINTDYNAQTSAIISSLDAEEVIPNTSGLAGANNLTKEELITLVSHMQNILSNMSSHTGGFNTTSLRQTWTKAVGAASMMG